MKREITKTLQKMAWIIWSSGQNFNRKTVQKLINSMSRRNQSYLDARGALSSTIYCKFLVRIFPQVEFNKHVGVVVLDVNLAEHSTSDSYYRYRLVPT